MAKLYVETSICLVPYRRRLAKGDDGLVGNAKRPIFLVHLGAGLEEASRGDGNAVKRRLAVLEGIKVLPLTDEAVRLSKALVENGGVPEKALDDALQHRHRRRSWH
uniref:Uncharacterized protein n=1 Tax=Candidatus Kentrum sp. TC TaxID=2126339 RepID=A0A450ZU79_9GAMM|nr:MAG: hypothetical protein BECKTC1821F_GA0114240_10175 [Candidatus Kentron sp. TC]